MIDIKKYIQGKVVFLGVGNLMKGDDGAGCIFIEELQKASKSFRIYLFNGGQLPENYLEKIIKVRPDKVFIVDAVDFNASPGKVRLFKEVEPSLNFSTHHLPLSFILKYLREKTKAEVFILGIQPKNIQWGSNLSLEVKSAVKGLIEGLTGEKEKIGRLHISIEGIVQGVGFRPFIYNLANLHSLAGYVLNNTRGVDIEVEGEREDIKIFLKELNIKFPPLAVIDKISWRKLAPAGYREFKIKSSQKEKESFLPLSPDIGICDDCLRELFNPEDRRYLYPFINCTNCGPRFTIIKDIPYDRENTTMASFKMCRDCEIEYHDSHNRRFHAQPDACWVCGPAVRLVDSRGEDIEVDEPVYFSAMLIKKGYILAVKGIGGYHLACDATNSETVKKLRERKYRVDKPFALMMLNIQQIKNFCEVSVEEEHLLLSPRRPIVLLKRKDKEVLPEEIAPKNSYLGVMLPYTPLHYLLLEKAKIPLVMTSGNISEEPIAYKDEEALCRLNKIAHAFLVHNREIQIRVDDSVGRIAEGKPMLVRRSRGYAPQPLKIGVEVKRCVLGMGGHLKNTFCFLKGDNAILSHHIGDLENLEALSAFEEGIEHYRKIFYLKPKIIACDIHPDYASTQFAEKYAQDNLLPLIKVQHHHAHIASLLAENKINEKIIGVAFDGSGLGTDGCIWGGEFLIADEKEFKRAAHLRYIALPGGEGAIKQPWRMALSYLYAIYGDGCIDIACQSLSNLVELEKIAMLKTLMDKKINSPLTSSTGRFFDAVSALLGIRGNINYEGQAAIELEMLA
ncbi:carbamoyltransferase HypF, partial [Candidatus Aerophobetes bacterium]|nr:carbamoyltransferase HypF [Candidatus Aerophobetes bacterium]